MCKTDQLQIRVKRQESQTARDERSRSTSAHLKDLLTHSGFQHAEKVRALMAQNNEAINDLLFTASGVFHIWKKFLQATMTENFFSAAYSAKRPIYRRVGTSSSAAYRRHRQSSRELRRSKMDNHSLDLGVSGLSGVGVLATTAIYKPSASGRTGKISRKSQLHDKRPKTVTEGYIEIYLAPALWLIIRTYKNIVHSCRSDHCEHMNAAYAELLPCWKTR